MSKKKSTPPSASSKAGAVRGGGSAKGRQPGRTTSVIELDSMDVWDRIAWVCLHILVILVPIAMSNLGPFNLNGAPLTYDQFDIVKVFFERTLMLIAVVSWTVGLMVRGGTIRWSKVGWLVLVFLAWVALTSLLSIHVPTAVFGKYRRFEGLVSFITYGATFLMALQMLDRPSRLRSLARSLAIGGFLVAFYGFLQVIGAVTLDVARVIRPVAVVVTLGVPILLAWRVFETDDEDSRRAMAIAAVITLVGGIMFSAAIWSNINYAVSAGSNLVSLDPVRWGTLPFETNRAFSTFGNPDLLGGYILFPWAVTLGLALSEKHRTWRVIYWSFTLLNAFVGLTSYVRGAWIGAAVALVVIMVAYWRAKQGTEMRLDGLDWAFIASSLAAVVTVVAVSALRTDAVRNVLTRLTSIFQFGQGSALTRFQIWEAARAAISERPIFGWGADTFRLLFPRFKPAEYVQSAGYLSVADNVHNYPLQLATGIGIPGALLMYGTIGWVLLDSAKRVFARGEGRRMLLLAGFWAAIVGYVVHLMFGLSVTGSTIFLWLSMGLLLSPSAQVRQVRPFRFAVPLSAVAVLVLVLGTAFNTRFIVADNHYLNGRLLTSGMGSVSELQKAIALNPYNEMYKLELGSAYQELFLATIREYVAGAKTGAADEATRELAVQYFERAETAYRTTMAYVPYEYDTYVFSTNLYNEGGTYLDPEFYEKAIEVAKQGVAVERYGPAVRVQMAIAYLGTGDVDSAIEQLEVATSLDSDYNQAFLALASAYKDSGRYEDARAAYQHVLKNDPDNASATAGLKALEASASSEASGSGG